MQVNILGTPYEINVKKYDEDEAFNQLIGYCDGYTKEIVVCDMRTHKDFTTEKTETCLACQKATLRHEIVHAFLDESGLMSSACEVVGAWCKNEEMVDWIALQGIKIYKAWQEADAI